MKTYVLKIGAKVPSDDNDIVWAFDLGKGSIGEAARRGNEFLHKASLLIPAEFAETKTARDRRRMHRTREAHKAREKWLCEVMQATGVEILKGRQIGKVDEQGNQIPKSEWKKKKGKWVQIAKGDYRLEREFPPRKFQKNKDGKLEPVIYPDGKAKDGAPAKTDEDFSTCYNSALLRIKLLRGEELKPWQVFKAFHSAMQKRGYGKVAWARREKKRLGKSEEEIEKALAKKDPAYKAALDAWKNFRQDIQHRKLDFFEKLQPSAKERSERNLPADYYFVPPCFYDTAKMRLWSPEHPDHLGIWNPNGATTFPPHGSLKTTANAQSTRNVRFDRNDVENEIRALVEGAANYYPALKGKAEYLLYGPAGKAYASYYPDLRKEHGLKEGGENDWQGVLGQKIPRFDNRIVNDCALLPRFQVCTVHFRFDGKGVPKPESLLHAEVAFLWKLKNLRFTRNDGEDSLTHEELKQIFDFPDASCYRVETKTWGKFAKEFKWDDSCLPKPIKPAKGKPQSREKMVAWFAEQLAGIQVLRGDGTMGKLKLEEKASIFTDVLLRSYELTESRLAAALDDLGGKPLPAQKEVDAPKPKGRSRYSRPALRLLREFVLKGLSPDEFRRKQEAKIPADADPKKGFIRDDLKSFCKERMGDSWQKAYVPNERLAMQVMRTGTTRTERDKAIGELIAEQNDPIVRHRLSVFATRLHELEKITKKELPTFEKPDYVALEFVRDNLPESFMGEEAQSNYSDWARKQQKEAKEALEIVKQLGCEKRNAVQKYLLLRSQGFQCVYFPNGSLNVSATKTQLTDSPCVYTEQKIGLANLDDLVIDHIVPQQGGYNGPDAIVNKVVTTRHVNEQMKKCRTPFEWFQQDMPDKWAAYVKRVSSLQGTLGKKKVRLLTQAEAPELVQKYTALAETAWISKLAQAILCIHFGWPFTLDEERRRKITVISGGLTGRVRRMYDLNRVLNPDAETREEAEKKNRNDDRHHALDAMVISFIPGWARNEEKENFFRFPEPIHKNAKGFFEKEIAGVVPRFIAFEKPRLEEKFYGWRSQSAGEIGQTKSATPTMVKRLENVADLPYKTENNRKAYDSSLKTAFKRIKKIRDPMLRQLFLDYFNQNEPDEAAWSQKMKEGFIHPNGSKIQRLLLDRGSPEEYVPISKDGIPERAWKRGEPHRGQIVYVETSTDKKGKIKETVQVRPVYAFESQAKVSKELTDKFGASIRIIGFFQSGCLVEVDKPVAHAKQPLPPGKYRLNTIITDGKQVKITTPDGKTFPAIPKYSLANMQKAGLRRIEMDWDKQISFDAKGGFLDKLAEEAKADISAGRLSSE